MSFFGFNISLILFIIIVHIITLFLKFYVYLFTWLNIWLICFFNNFQLWTHYELTEKIYFKLPNDK